MACVPGPHVRRANKLATLRRIAVVVSQYSAQALLALDFACRLPQAIVEALVISVAIVVPFLGRQHSMPF